MLLVILYLMAKSGGFSSALPIIALYAFAAYRLMPALQQIYGAFTQLRFAGPALEALHKDLNSLQAAHIQHGHLSPLRLTQAITLNQVSYSYPNAPDRALKDIDLSIPAHSTVGFVGATGSGKTTTVDVILGLLEPQEGVLKIDGQPISVANRRQWQRAIGYVPQHIYLADDSVATNIAFGVNSKDINQHAVERAAKIANLHEFVSNDLPQGYATTVGERGYASPVGSASNWYCPRSLPQPTGADSGRSHQRAGQSHRKSGDGSGEQPRPRHYHHSNCAPASTVRQCDQIYLLERGEVKVKGTFEELTQANERFRAMAASH